MNLDLDGVLDSLALLLGTVIGLLAHDTTTPVAARVLSLVSVALLDGRQELGELGLVLGADLGEGQDGGGLLVNDRAETSLALDDSVRDTHLAAESGKEDNQLNRVNVVSNQDEGSLLVLDQADNVVETVLDVVGLLADILLLLALGDSGSLLDETLLLLSLGLRAVLGEELEGLGSGVAVQGALELSDRRGNLQTHVQNLLLALEADIFGPLDEAGQVALGLDVLADTEVAGALLDERVLWQRHYVVSSSFHIHNITLPGGKKTNLSGLLGGASLALGVGQSGGLLSGLGRLSLRKEDQLYIPPQAASSLNSRENMRWSRFTGSNSCLKPDHHQSLQHLFRGCWAIDGIASIARIGSEEIIVFGIAAACEA